METSSGDKTTAPRPPPPPPHVVIFPTPGMGHLTPLTHLATRLLPHFSFTIALTTDGTPSAAETTLLSSLPAGIDAVFLPSDDPPTVKLDTFTLSLSLTLARSLPSLRRLLAARPAAALVVDIFGTDAFDVAQEFNLRPYLFFPTTATLLSFSLHLEKLNETTSPNHLDEPVFIPGCKPVQRRDLPAACHDRESDNYKCILHHTKRYTLAEGIMINSFEGIEKGALEELMRPEPGRPPVYPIGPAVQTGLGQPSGLHDCVKWLDEQPCGSVLYVSFGSGGTLSVEKQNELALGLEMSNQRFMWVARKPNDFNVDASDVGEGDRPNSMSFMPEGFLARTADRGLVVPNWAPQNEVLGHKSIGGFLTHCGWNSVLESVVHGVPVIVWPLYAEQRLNSVVLVEGLHVGFRLSTREAGVIQADEIARVVTSLMEGEEGKMARRRMEGLKKAASIATSEDGSSTRALNEIATIWKCNVCYTPH